MFFNVHINQGSGHFQVGKHDSPRCSLCFHVLRLAQIIRYKMTNYKQKERERESVRECERERQRERASSKFSSQPLVLPDLSYCMCIAQCTSEQLVEHFFPSLQILLMQNLIILYNFAKNKQEKQQVYKKLRIGNLSKNIFTHIAECIYFLASKSYNLRETEQHLIFLLHFHYHFSVIFMVITAQAFAEIPLKK